MSIIKQDYGSLGNRDIEVGKEYKVGTFTLNGVTYDRYVKIVDCEPPNTKATTPSIYWSSSTAIGVDNIVGYLNISAIAAYGNNLEVYQIGSVNVAYPGTYDTEIGIRNNNAILIRSKFDMSTYHHIFVLIEYYK